MRSMAGCLELYQRVDKMTKKYTSPEHAIRNIMEGGKSAAAEVLFGIGKAATHSFDDVMNAIKKGEKISDDMLKGLSP